jgi:hypothetical protein
LPPLERGQDRVQDPLDVAEEFVIVEAGHTVASIAQGLFSRPIATALVIGRMSRAVDLDDQLFLAANEVGEIGTDRLLPDELEASERAVSKSPPKLAFGLGLVPAQRARSACFMPGGVRAIALPLT